MYTEEQLDELEQKEHGITEEELAIMILAIGVLHSELENEIRLFYQKYGKDGVVTWKEARKWISEKNHTKRLIALMIAVNLAFGRLSDDFKKAFNSFLREVISLEGEFFNVDLDDEKLMDTAWGEDEKNWLERLDDDIALWVYVISKDIKQSILKGNKLDDVLEKLDKRFYSIEKVTKKLAYSESTAMGSMARKDVFKKLRVKKYKFFSRVDERRCDGCGGLHGKIFPMSAYEVGVTASPIHPHCRCWEIPILD